MEQLTPEQILARLREVDVERENLLRQKAALEEHLELAQREREELKAEMDRLGTSPQTIRADLARLTEELARGSEEYADQVRQSVTLIDSAKKALVDLQSSKRR